MVHAFHKAGFATKYVCKDLMVPKIPSEESDSEPYPRAKSLFLALDKDWGHYPIHLCPGSLSVQGPYGALVSRFLTNNQYLTTGISIGVSGQGPTSKEGFVKLNQWLERRVKDLDGVGWIYSSPIP